MGHTIALQVPDNLYEAIRSHAIKQGQTPDDLAARWLDEAIHRATRVEKDPLVELFGTLQSDATDVAERHNYYIGRALSQALHDGE